MANRFWQFLTRFIPGETVRAEPVNNQFFGIEAALDKVQAELDRAAMLPASLSGKAGFTAVTEPALLQVDPVNGVGLYPMTTFTDQVNQVASQYGQIQGWHTDMSDWAAAYAASVSWAQLAAYYANHPEDTEIPGLPGVYSAYHWMRKCYDISGGTAPDSVALGGIPAGDFYHNGRRQPWRFIPLSVAGALAAGEQYLLLTNATFTLPATPSTGDAVVVVRGAGAEPVISGSAIHVDGQTDTTLTLDAGGMVTLVWTGARWEG